MDDWEDLRKRVLAVKDDDVLIFRDAITGKQYVIGEYETLMRGAVASFMEQRNKLLEKAISMIHEEFVKAINVEAGEDVTRRVMERLIKTMDEEDATERLIPYDDQPRTPRNGLFEILENLGRTDPPEAC